MNIAFAVRALAPPPPVSPWHRSTMTWRGWDGTEFDFTDPDGGVFLTKQGVEGLNMPEHLAWTGQSPATHGQYYRGHVIEPRRAFWPIYLYSDAGTEEWVERDRAFWRTLQPGKHGTWTVTTPVGGKRSLSCRFVDDGGHAYAADPMFRGWAAYGVSLIADNPFWTGEAVRRIWSDGAESDFYADRMPLKIVSASTLGSATMTNEGDLEAWPVWTIIGPLTSVTVGVDGATIQWNVALTADDILVIDTDPTVQSAWLNGDDVTEQLGTADFAPIPSGLELPLSLTMAGTGSVQASITPRYYKAW